MPGSRASSWSLFGAALLALASLACSAYPLYVIWPFRRQGATELQAALFVLRIGPWVSILCAAGCAALVLFTWRRGWIRRAAAVLCVFVAAAGAYLTRFNIYERVMFHPIGAPAFEVATEAKLDPADMVIAVRVDGANRAYPVREVAYHHVVNDTLRGVPIVATY